jgi:hypothetical protein
MAKITGSKLRGGLATKAWKMAREGKSYKEIGDAVNRTSSAVKLYVQRKYKDEANKLWSLEIRSVGHCEIAGCHNTDLNAHHILGKGAYPHLRFDLSNGVCLCSGHHTFDKDVCPHGTLPAVEGFIDWLITNRQGQYQFYQENKDDRRLVDMDYEQEYNNLTQEND